MRIVASTTRDLTREMSGLLEPFRRMLSANRIAVPALADRREDIPALVDHFVRKHARQIGKIVDRRVAGVDAPAAGVCVAGQHPRAANGARARDGLVSKSSVLEIDEELLDERLAVGSYRLMEPLGSGGMGEVWRAQHRLLARPAAVKLIRHNAQAGRDT